MTISRCSFLSEPPVDRGSSAGEPVEQLRVRRLAAHLAEVVRRVDEPAAEVPLPDAVDDHAPGQRVLRVGQPLRQRGAAVALGAVFGRSNSPGSFGTHASAPGSTVSPGLRMSPRLSTRTSRGIGVGLWLPSGGEVRRGRVDHRRRRQRREFARRSARVSTWSGQLACLLRRALRRRRSRGSIATARRHARDLHRRLGRRDRQPEAADQVPAAVELLQPEDEFRLAVAAGGFRQLEHGLVRLADLRVDAPGGRGLPSMACATVQPAWSKSDVGVADRDRLRLRALAAVGRRR